MNFDQHCCDHFTQFWIFQCMQNLEQQRTEVFPLKIYTVHEKPTLLNVITSNSEEI